MCPEEEEEGHEQGAGPGRPQCRQGRREEELSCSWKPCSLDEPQAEHLGAPVGFLRVHLEHAQVLRENEREKVREREGRK